MVSSGVDIMELQIPFSEPIADGPVILRANQMSLAGGTTVKKLRKFEKKQAFLTMKTIAQIGEGIISFISPVLTMAARSCSPRLRTEV